MALENAMYSQKHTRPPISGGFNVVTNPEPHRGMGSPHGAGFNVPCRPPSGGQPGEDGSLGHVPSI